MEPENRAWDEYSMPPRPYQRSNALVAALNNLAAVISARRPQPSADATAAAAQYDEIKGTLRTYSERPGAATAAQAHVQAIQATEE
jgi:hypothetical protein